MQDLKMEFENLMSSLLNKDIFEKEISVIKE